MAREADWKIFTNAGPEIGVASTKAFTTQLAALLMLALSISKSQDKNADKRKQATQELRETPALVDQSFNLKENISLITQNISTKHNALFLGRGMYFPFPCYYPFSFFKKGNGLNDGSTSDP